MENPVILEKFWVVKQSTIARFYCINTRNAKNANYCKKANNAKKAKN